MDFTAFIRELLFSHDCVIVPGFGGFIGNYSPARIDKATGTFYPPVKQISFNRNLNHNDGLLVGKISSFTGMNYGDSRSMVEEFTSGILRKLDRGEKVVFDHIGSFVNNQEGGIQFEPDRSANYHLDSYGLEPFRIMPLEGHYIHPRISRTTDRDPEKQASMRKIMWRAAVIVPLLAVLVAVPLKTDLFRAGVESSNLNPLVTAEFEHNRKAVEESTGTAVFDKPADNLNKEENIKTEVKQAPVEITPAKQPDISEALPKTNPVVEAPSKQVVVPSHANESANYYLITGSYKSEENAMSHVRILKSQGFNNPEIVRTSNGFFRVYAMSCNDLATAELKKDSISGQFPGSWISTKK